MTLLNPGLLPWLLLAGIPIAIHLLTRHTRRTYALPTFQFLKQSVARQSPIYRMKQLLLLATRTLLIVAVVLAFLKPVRSSLLPQSTGEGRTAIIILDASYSMVYRGGGISTFQRAQSQCAQIISGLSGADRANAILAGATPRPAADLPNADRSTINTFVASAQPTQERADVNAALNLAAEQLKRSHSGGAVVYLVSDFQRTNWSEARLDVLPADAKAVFINASDQPRDNAAITYIKLQPASARAGQDISAAVEVWNGSSKPKNITVTLKPGDKPAETQSGLASPYSSVTLNFPCRFEQPGRFVFSASIPADELPGDDQRLYVADLLSGLRVLLLTDEDASKPPAGTYYLSRALNPNPGEAGGIQVTPRRPQDMTESDVRNSDAIILDNVQLMPADKLPIIAKYVQDGGSLIAFLTGTRVQVQMEALNRLGGGKDGLAFLPTTPIDVSGRGKGYVQLNEARFESKLLRVFRDPSVADLGSIQFKRFFLTTEPDPHAEVLLKFDDGTPAAARRNFGSGSILLCNFSPSPVESDLAKKEVFPPLMHELLKGISTRASDSREFSPGMAASLTIPPTSSGVSVLDPDGSVVPSNYDRATGAVLIDRTPRTGLYTVQSGGKEVSVAAVNIHSDESDLRSIDPGELQARNDKREPYVVGGSGRAQDVGDLSKDRPIWPYFVGAALLLLLTEQLLAGLSARSRPKPMPAMDHHDHHHHHH